MNKAWIVCENAHEAWIEPILRKVLDGIYETAVLHGTQWEQNDLIVLADSWNTVGNTELLSRLITHTARGGRLLFLGKGTLVRDCYELTLLMGRSFLRELPWGQLSLRMSKSPLMAELSDCETWDTPVFFAQDVFDRAETLISFTYGKKEYAAAWHKDWCRGHVYCLSMGRTQASLESFAALVRAIGADAAERGRTV